MKRYLLLALGVFLAMPAAVGAVDAWCYVLLGRAVTGVVWNGDSVIGAVLFLIPAAGCALVAGFAAEEDTGPFPAYVPPPPPPRRAGSNPPPTYERPPAPPSPPPARDLRGSRQ